MSLSLAVHLKKKTQPSTVVNSRKEGLQNTGLFSLLLLLLPIMLQWRTATAFVQPRTFHRGTVTIGWKNILLSASSSAKTTKSLSLSLISQRYYAPTISPLILQAARTKNSYSERQQSLVVHGPEGFTYPPKRNGAGLTRPFKLVIVESPSKCKTISNILTKYVEDNQLEYDYVVTSCMGHVRNLPKKKASKNQTIPGIDVENGYEPTYELMPQKESLVRDLKQLSEQAQQLILATDDDREGEAMAWHLLELLLVDNHSGKNQDFLIHEEDSAATLMEGNVISEQQQLPPLRVRFTEITPKAIVGSIQNPNTSLRDNLVQAQETRRILDRLAGFTVSPVLWKKIAPGLSAGRVQSVGMALVVQRERERLLFQETEYWDLEGSFCPPTPTQLGQSDEAGSFRGQLISINGTNLAFGGSDFESHQANTLSSSARNKLHLQEEAALNLALNVRENHEEWTWIISDVASTERKFNAPSPFTTSTLQQEANNKLGLSVSNTMSIAQRLYENGFISYMRTDSEHLSDDAIAAIRSEIYDDYGGIENYRQRPVKKKSKSSKKKKSTGDKLEPQAAHEAIRPAIQGDRGFAKPSELNAGFSDTEQRLYQLIYQRSVAAFMAPQVTNQTSIRIQGKNGDTTLVFKASGSVILKPGFTMVYRSQPESKSPTLPTLFKGQHLDCEDVAALLHTTKPPPRYTEASFVKELEALGVGRPSTYASIVKILRDRGYVGSPNKDGYSSSSSATKTLSVAQRAAGGEEFVGGARGPLVPSLSAFVVCSLLERHCPTYVDPGFTAQMEERLDKIATSEEHVGKDERVSYLDEFYAGDEGLAAKIQRIDKKVSAEDARRAILPALGWNATDTDQPKNGSSHNVGLFIGPWGPYVQKLEVDADGDGVEDIASEKSKPATAPLPPGMAADLSSITPQTLSAVLLSREQNGAILGQHPDDERNIRLKIGRFGAYLQWGEDNEDGTTTHTLPRAMGNMRNIDTTKLKDAGASLSDILGVGLEEAIQYCNLPRTVCELHGSSILASIGPYGPYLKYNNTFMSIPNEDVLTIDPETAEALVTEGIINKKTRLGRGVLAEIGEKDGSKVTVKSGRFGMYLNWKKVNAKMPAEYVENPSELPFDEAWALIEAKAGSITSKVSKSKNRNTAGIELPPAPKRPLSAYLHFCAEKRPEVAANTNSLGATSKELARLWAETSEQARLPYTEMAKSSKKIYEEVKMTWEKECQELLKKNGANKSSSKSSSAALPKRPKSAYLYFCAAKRPEVTEKFQSLGEVSKELARLWSVTSGQDRKEYEELAAADKARYEREKLSDDMAASGTTIAGSTKNKKASSSPKTKSSSAKKKRAARKKITATKERTSPKKRAPSAYILFCSAHRKDVVDEHGNKLPLGETTKRLAQMWKECDDETRARFENESANQKKELVSA